MINFKRQLLLIFLSLCLVSVSVLASTPSFTVTDTLEEDIVNGENDVGDLIFIEQSYIPENYTFNNFSVLNLQQFDIATWNGNGTIKITSPTNNETTIVSGNSYTFSLDGTYSFELLSNSSTTSSIIASRYDNIDIEIEVDSLPNGFNISFSDTSFTLNNERVISETVFVDDDVATDEYEIDILINNVSYTQDFTVGANRQWSIDEDDVNTSITAKSGDNIYIGHFLVKNTGNSDVEITTTKYGTNNYIIGIPQPQTLYKKSTLRIDLQLQVPTTFSPGTYNYNVTLSGGDTNFTKDIKIVIVDSIKPIIEEINFSSNKAFKTNDIVVIASDNDEVKSVFMKYSEKTIDFIKDEQQFTASHSFDKLSQYNLNFCAIDNANNKNCVLINKTFEKIVLISEVDTQIKLPSKKIGKYSTITLFNLSDETTESVFIELVEFVSLSATNNTESYSIRIIDGDGTVRRLTKYENEVEIKSPGDIKLEIRSEEIADYSGILRVILPDYASEISDVSFTVSFKEYDIPEDFTKDWIDDRKLVCTVVDTGNLDTSYYSCTLEFPIDTRPEEISVPTTVSERDSFKAEASNVEKTLKIFKKRSAIFITLLMVSLILLGSIVYYVLYQRPYIRFSFGHKLKNKYNNKGEVKKA